MSGPWRHPMTHAAAIAPALPALLCTALALALGGCGSGRVQAPNLAATAGPSGVLTLRYPADGVALQVPGDWTVTPEKPPMVAVFSSGAATISLWRFPGRSAAITSSAQLRSALAALIRAARAGDPSLRVQRAGLSHVSDAGAVIIDALERVAGRRRRVRSEHVYVNGAELVLDAYAPPAQFPSVDRAVFSPVRRSLVLLHDGQPAAGPDSTSTSTATATSTGSP